MVTKVLEGRNKRIIPLMIEHQFVEDSSELNDPKKKAFFEKLMQDLKIEEFKNKALLINEEESEFAGWKTYKKEKEQIIKDMQGARVRVTIKVEYENFI